MPRGTDRQQVPKLLRFWLYAYLLAAGAAGVAALDGYSPLPTTVLLDVWIIALAVRCIVRGTIERTGALLLLVAYLATRILPAIYNESPLEDTFQAYRWVVYLVTFVLLVGRHWGPPKPLRVVTFLLIAMALLKASLVYVLVGPGLRPGLLIENNFEIALFSGAIAAQYRVLTGQQRLLALSMLAGLMILAGSRSGAVAFAVLVAYALTQLNRTTATKAFVSIYALPVVVLVPVLVFSARSVPNVEVDRLNFLDVFLYEAGDWTSVQWLFGTMPLTPLSPPSCSTLSFYESLFSTAGDGSCYSVILHAFVLRVVFDAGIVGLLIAFGVPWLALKWSGATFTTRLALLGIAAANSLSVSGLNNPYVALPILLAIGLVGNDRPEPEQEPEPELERARVDADLSRALARRRQN